MATYTERCGGGFPETASIEFKDERIELVMGNQEYGSGLVTSYKQIVSDQLGVDADRIDVIMGDTDRTPAGLTGGSRALAVAGTALYEAGRTIIGKGKELAAHLLEVVGAGRRLRRRSVRACPAPISASISLQVAKAARDPAKLPPGMEPGLDTTHTRVPPAQTFPNGCHIVEVEIDRDTGAVAIVRYTVVDDFGRTINPLMLEGQVHGGIVQGIGQALLEHAVYDSDSGQLLVRLVHGLRHAARRRSAVVLVLDPQRAGDGQSARRQGRGRGRRGRRAAGGDQCHRRRAAPPQRRAPHRHAGDAAPGLGGNERQARSRSRTDFRCRG